MKKPLAPVSAARVRIDDAFWAPRLHLNRVATLPAVYRHCVETGRIGALRLGWKPGDPNPPHVFWESDVAKWVEAASYVLAQGADAELSARVEEIIGLLAAAQRPDGYLNVHFTVVSPGLRWTNLRDKHELYCAGHWIEAAVAHYQATGRTSLLDIVRRYVAHVATVFGRGEGRKRGYPGHPEIELALVRLYRATGDASALELARYFVDERGQSPQWFDEEAKARGEDPRAYWAGTHEYTQSHAPVREQARAVGHAVRALYLYSAMTDLGNELGDDSLMAAVLRLWDSVYLRQAYVTGGIGASRANEGFAADYELPNATAYAETCAAIASVFWNHRLLHWNCEARFADELERALYNGVLAGVSLDGSRFFYANPLAMNPAAVREGDPYVTPGRVEWPSCACCPPNVARLLASLGQYVYSESDTEVAVHLFVQSRVELGVAGGGVVLRQETDYPWEGHVRLMMESLRAPATFTLRARVPGWCRDPLILVNGEPWTAARKNGYAVVAREWKAGDVVELVFPMPVERVRSHPLVLANRGCVALQRGPLVYCVESVDNGPLGLLALPRRAPIEARFEPGLLGGSKAIYATAVQALDDTWDGRLYRREPEQFRETPLRAVPYYAWSNRGVGEMAVWLREVEMEEGGPAAGSGGTSMDGREGGASGKIASAGGNVGSTAG